MWFYEQEVSNELDKLSKIYGLFKEQKDFQVGSIKASQ